MEINDEFGGYDRKKGQMKFKTKGKYFEISYDMAERGRRYVLKQESLDLFKKIYCNYAKENRIKIDFVDKEQIFTKNEEQIFLRNLVIIKILNQKKDIDMWFDLFEKYIINPKNVMRKIGSKNNNGK